MQLTDRDVAILTFEDRSFASDSAKLNAIVTELGLSPARYFQIVNILLDNPAALAAKPMLVKRLRRVRAARAAARQARVFRVPAAG